MSDKAKMHQKGVATLFNQLEIKNFLKNYLILIGVVEALIFFASFVSQMGPENIPFPWKSYLFAAFIVPVAITFLLGIFVMGFNKYLFDNPKTQTPEELSVNDLAEGPVYLRKFHAFLSAIQQLPFLLSLLLLGLFSGLVYNLDSIFSFIARAGEKTAQYLLISMGVILLVASVFAFVWIYLNFKLKQTSMQYRHQYKNEVIKHLGIVILDDNTVIDNDGRVIAASPEDESPAIDVLPKLPSPLRKKNNDIKPH